MGKKAEGGYQTDSALARMLEHMNDPDHARTLLPGAHIPAVGKFFADPARKVGYSEAESHEIALSPEDINNEQMTHVPRQEFELQLTRIQEKIDSFVQRINDRDEAARRAVIDRQGLEDRLAIEREKRELEREKREEERQKSIDERDKRFEALAQQIQATSNEAKEAAEKAANLRNHLWGSVLAQFVAIVALIVGSDFAIQAFSITFTDTVRDSYEFGKNSAKSPTSPTVERDVIAPIPNSAPPAPTPTVSPTAPPRVAPAETPPQTSQGK